MVLSQRGTNVRIVATAVTVTAKTTKAITAIAIPTGTKTNWPAPGFQNHYSIRLSNQTKRPPVCEQHDITASPAALFHEGHWWPACPKTESALEHPNRC